MIKKTKTNGNYVTDLRPNIVTYCNGPLLPGCLFRRKLAPQEGCVSVSLEEHEKQHILHILFLQIVGNPWTCFCPLNAKFLSLKTIKSLQPLKPWPFNPPGYPIPHNYTGAKIIFQPSVQACWKNIIYIHIPNANSESCSQQSCLVWNSQKLAEKLRRWKEITRRDKTKTKYICTVTGGKFL